LRKLLSFIAILLLATSIFPIGFADTIPTDSSNNESIELDVIQTKIILISLEEKIGLTSESPRKIKIENLSLFVDDSQYKSIDLIEGLTFTTSSSDQKIHFDSIKDQPHTIIERIFQTDKIRDDRKKSLKIETLYLDDSYQQQSLDNSISINFNVLQTTFFTDPLKIICNPLCEYNFKNILESINISDELLTNNIFNSINIHFDSSFIFDNNFIVVIFAPLVFFLFIFSEDVKFRFEKIRPLLSFVCVLIILSTVVVTPYSISSSYWPEAYADSGNIHEIISDNTTASTDISS